MKPLITLSSDFEKQSYGCGAMEGVIYEVNPDAHLIHHMHGIEGFNLFQAARTMETLVTMPVGFHVCVVDPGVGTKRRGIAIQTVRGDYLIGPDNGILRPGAEALGGIVKAHELQNPKYQRQPVSPIFHGRDVFAMAAGYLSKGVSLEEFGPSIPVTDLIPSPYLNAEILGSSIPAIVIHKNALGNIFFNILQKTWDEFGVPLRGSVTLSKGTKTIRLTHVRTFGEVSKNHFCIMKDDYTRIEAAVTEGNFLKKFPVKLGEKVIFKKS
ncbi:MAG: SAM-dependent chlorinase/fluorinase [Deltaproteobacteria bacterium]|nr:SAM-dependent chlorinase/fluorinase [Deltaproteobacteria bacterium]